MEEDWTHDSKGKNKMNRKDLEDALFELADIWVKHYFSSNCLYRRLELINLSILNKYFIIIIRYVSFFETLRFKFAFEN